MSSDESDVDDAGFPIYFVNRMPWRPDFEKEIKLVDQQRITDKSLYSKKGAKPVPRIRGSRRADSRRGPYQGRPKSLYEKSWLGGQTDAALRNLGIPKKKFKLRKIL